MIQALIVHILNYYLDPIGLGGVWVGVGRYWTASVRDGPKAEGGGNAKGPRRGDGKIIACALTKRHSGGGGKIKALGQDEPP